MPFFFFTPLHILSLNNTYEVQQYIVADEEEKSDKPHVQYLDQKPDRPKCMVLIRI